MHALSSSKTNNHIRCFMSKFISVFLLEKYVKINTKNDHFKWLLGLKGTVSRALNVWVLTSQTILVKIFLQSGLIFLVIKHVLSSVIFLFKNTLMPTCVGAASLYLTASTLRLSSIARETWAGGRSQRYGGCAPVGGQGWGAVGLTSATSGRIVEMFLPWTVLAFWF